MLYHLGSTCPLRAKNGLTEGSGQARWPNDSNYYRSGQRGAAARGGRGPRTSAHGAWIDEPQAERKARNQFSDAGSKPGGGFAILMRCRKIFSICVGSVMTASTLMGSPHREQGGGEHELIPSGAPHPAPLWGGYYLRFAASISGWLPP